MGSGKEYRKGSIDQNKKTVIFVTRAISEIPGLSRATPK